MALGMNYASKYSPKVDERFTKQAFTAGITNNDYEFVGVNAVNVYTVPTVAMSNYSLTGTSRYGTPSELQNDVQTLTLTKDRSFTFTIDRKNHDDTMMVMEAGKALSRQINEVVIPEVDKYRIAVITAAAPSGHTITKATTSANAYEEFLAVQEVLDEALAPQGGRVVLMTPSYFSKIKLDSAFVKAGDLATKIAINGVVGEIDGVPAIKVPSSYVPADVDFVITNAVACVAPVKLEEYKIHTDAPGISGWLVEGRIRYDAFVLNNKADAIGVHKAK